MYFMPQSGAMTQPVGGDMPEAVADAIGNDGDGFDLGITEVEHAEHDLFARQILQYPEIELRLRRLD